MTEEQRRSILKNEIWKFESIIMFICRFMIVYLFHTTVENVHIALEVQTPNDRIPLN